MEPTIDDLLDMLKAKNDTAVLSLRVQALCLGRIKKAIEGGDLQGALNHVSHALESNELSMKFFKD